MAGGHAHSHSQGATGPGSEPRLWFALAMTGAFLAVEVVASYFTGNLALLSDAGHMTTSEFARRPNIGTRQFSYASTKSS